MALFPCCVSVLLSLAPAASPQETSAAAPTAAESRSATPAPSNTPPQSFDPKVRRIGVQQLDEAPVSAPRTPEPVSEHPVAVEPDAPVTVLPPTQIRSETEPAPSNSDEVCEMDLQHCTPRPTFKLGAQLILLPIQDTGIKGNKEISSRRILQRARLSASGRWRSLGVKAEVQDVRRWGQGATAGGTSELVNLALHQGYFEITGESKALGYRSFIRAGRQEIVWGEQRLLGYGLWSIHGRSHDAIRALLEYKNFDFDLFWSVRRPSPQPSEGIKNSGAHLGGARFATRHLKAFSAEVQGLIHHNDGDSPQSTDTLGNVGVRIFGDPIKQLHYSLEANYQFGKRLTMDHQAWAVAGWASWYHEFSGGVGTRFKLGATAASGDKGDGKSREFFNFYPANHRNYGMMDLLGWRNMVDYEAQLTYEFDGVVNIGAAYHYLALQSTDGDWKDAPGTVLARGGAVADKDKSLGSEVDLFLTYQPLVPLSLQLGYGLWLPTQAAYERVAAVPGQKRVQQRLFLLVKAKL